MSVPPRLTVAAVVLVVAGCGPAPCRTVESSQRGATGAIFYRTADGLRSYTTDTAEIWSLTDQTLVLTASLDGANGDRRRARLDFRRLQAGATLSVPAQADVQLCLSLQTGTPPACLPLEGSITVRELSSECWTHESGISICAQNADAEVDLATQAQGLDVLVDLDVVAVERWTDTSCEEE